VCGWRTACESRNGWSDRKGVDGRSFSAAAVVPVFNAKSGAKSRHDRFDFFQKEQRGVWAQARFIASSRGGAPVAHGSPDRTRVGSYLNCLRQPLSLLGHARMCPEVRTVARFGVIDRWTQVNLTNLRRSDTPPSAVAGSERLSPSARERAPHTGCMTRRVVSWRSRRSAGNRLTRLTRLTTIRR
jgi:hypothetical protein